MANQTTNPSITILRMVNLSRVSVLFTLATQVFYISYTMTQYTIILLWLFVLDFIGFLLLLVPREPLKQFGYVWAGLMSIALMSTTPGYLGTGSLASDVIVILLMSSIQLLTFLKMGIDTYNTASLGDDALKQQS
jgi:hypothetical protein